MSAIIASSRRSLCVGMYHWFVFVGCFVGWFLFVRFVCFLCLFVNSCVFVCSIHSIDHSFSKVSDSSLFTQVLVVSMRTEF